MAVSINEPDGGFSGKSYELNLYLLFLHRGCRNNNYGFKLHREQKDAGKFDDLVFEFVENGSTVYRLLQAKHSVNPEKRISEQMLFSGGDGAFDLIKYLVSYRTAKQNYSTKGQIKDFVICTSRSFDFKQLKTDIEKITEADSILYLGNEDKESVKYRLKNTKPNFGKIKGEWKKRMNKWIKENDVRKTQPEPHEAEIEEFLNHLIFAVDMPNDTDLGTILKDEIGEEFNEMTRKDIYNRAFQRMIDWMKANDNRNFWTHEDAMAMFEDIKLGFTLPYDVRYNVQPPVKRFIGRIEQLEKLDELLQKEKQVMICGFGGVGKTELVREYIKKHSEKYYNNILWIDAERETGKDDAEKNAEKDIALVNSFRGLASGKLKIGTKGANGEEKEISVVIGEVYQWFQQSKSLFVFDNAEWHQYQDYMRPSLPGNVREPYIIAISRVKWQKEDLISRIDLSEFTEPEAIRFISESLPKFLENGRQSDSVHKLAETLQYFPLALCQAVAYINGKFRHETKTYKLSEYIDNFSKKSLEYLNYPISKYCESKYSKTVWTTWNVTIEALQNEENYTPDALNYMSFLLPNDIHADLLLKLFEDKDKLKETILLLDKYSLITVRESFYSLHSLVQLVNREKLKRDERREVLKNILKVIVEKDKIIALSVDHLTSAWRSFKEDFTEDAKKYDHTPATIAFVLFNIGRYKEAFSLGIEALKLIQNFPLENEKKQQYVQNIASIIVKVLCDSGKYEEALNKSEEILTILKDINKRFPYTSPILSIENDIILTYLHRKNVTSALKFLKKSPFNNEMYSGKYDDIVLFRQEVVTDIIINYFEYNGAFTMYCQLLNKRIGISKVNDSEILRISKKVAKASYQNHVYAKMAYRKFFYEELIIKTGERIPKDFAKEVLSILHKAHEEQKKMLPNNHSERLETQESIVSLLIGQEKYEEAWTLFKDISDEGLARNNCSLLTKKATVLAFLNKNDRASAICEDLKKEILTLDDGDFKKNHPEVVDRCVGLALVLSWLSKFDDALNILGEIWKRMKYSVSFYNVYVKYILETIGYIYIMQNKNVEGKSSFEEALRCSQNIQYTVLSGKFPQNTFQNCWNLRTLAVLRKLSPKKEQVVSQLELRDILKRIDFCEQTPGFPRQNVCLIKRSVTKMYVANSDYDKALSMLTEVRESQENFLMKDDPDYQETCNLIDITRRKKVLADSNKSEMTIITDPFETVQLGNFDRLLMLVNDGMDVNAADENKWTLLHHAVSTGQVQIMLRLLKLGADVNALTGDCGNTVLHIASEKGMLKIVRLLLEHGAVYNAKNKAGKSPLEMARGIVVESVLRDVHVLFQSLLATSGDDRALELVKKYPPKEFYAVFHARNSNGDRLLKLAVANNCKTLVESILGVYGKIRHDVANVDYVTYRDYLYSMLLFDESVSSILQSSMFLESFPTDIRLPLRRCWYKNLIKKLSEQSELGRTIEDMLVLLDCDELSYEVEKLGEFVVGEHMKQFFKNYYSAIILNAARCNDLITFKLCLDKQPFLDLIDKEYRTPLHYAAEAGNEAMVKLLLDADIDYGKINMLQDEFPLHLAAKNGHVEVARLLLREYPEFVNDGRRSTRETALHLAAKNGHLAVVKLLLEHHADYSFPNITDQTPADVAASQEIKDLFGLIDELHADADVERVLERLSVFEFDERRPLLSAINSDRKQLWQVLAAKCTDTKKLLDVIGEPMEVDSKLQADLMRKLLDLMLEVIENKNKCF